MRKTWLSRKTPATTVCSSRARAQVGAERLLDHDAHVGVRGAVEAGALDLLDDDREELRRGREVVGAVERLARLLVEHVERRAQRLVALGVVEVGGDVLDVLQQPVEHRVVGRAARELDDRLAALAREVVVALLAPGDADQLEALRQRALVREVVERGEQLAVREVAGGAEDDERGGRDRQALEPFDERVLLGLGGGRGVDGHRSQPPPAVRSTAWPPNWPRSAASTRWV